LQTDYQMCQTDLAEVKQELQLARSQLQATVQKDVAVTANV